MYALARMARQSIKEIPTSYFDLTFKDSVRLLSFVMFSSVLSSVFLSQLLHESHRVVTIPISYRSHYFTETAVSVVFIEIACSVDAGHVCALVLLNLRAIFDTVYHEILMPAIT